MTAEEKLAKIIALIQPLAAQGTWADSDDFNPADSSGGNFDDAYYAGADDGETNLARRILGILEQVFNMGRMGIGPDEGDGGFPWSCPRCNYPNPGEASNCMSCSYSANSQSTRSNRCTCECPVHGSVTRKEKPLTKKQIATERALDKKFLAALKRKPIVFGDNIKLSTTNKRGLKIIETFISKATRKPAKKK